MNEERNERTVQSLEPDFIRRKEYFRSGARLAAPLYEHRNGGGALMYAFGADHPAIESYAGSQQLTAPGFTLPGGFAAWAATANGGPYGIFDGATRALYTADATWQEAVGNTLLVGHWCYLPALVTGVIASKWDTGGNNRSWTLIFNAATSFEFYCNVLGTAAASVVVTSSVTVLANAWYYVAGFFQASTLQRIYVARLTDLQPTPTSLTIGVPASLFNGTAPLAIGTQFAAAPVLNAPWNGYIGDGGARIALPAANIDDHVAQLFTETQVKYR